jgi:hypothetical protein
MGSNEDDDSLSPTAKMLNQSQELVLVLNISSRPVIGLVIYNEKLGARMRQSERKDGERAAGDRHGCPREHSTISIRTSIHQISHTEAYACTSLASIHQLLAGRVLWKTTGSSAYFLASE